MILIKKLKEYIKNIEENKKIVILTENNLEETIKNNKETGVQVEQRICPNCGSTLVLKRSKFGTLFYACPGYPTCRYTESR